MRQLACQHLRRPSLLQTLVLSLLTITVATAITGHATPVAASSVEAMSNRVLVERSDLVAYGRINSTTAEFNADRTQIQTLVEVEVFEAIKGNIPGASISFRIPGGQRDGQTYLIHGMPSFIAGQELVMCMSGESGPRNLRMPIGLDQGAWRVVATPGGQLAVRRRSGRHVATRVGEAGTTASALTWGQAYAEQLVLDELLAELRSYVK